MNEKYTACADAVREAVEPGTLVKMIISKELVV
jgi:hypothetical protein